MEKIIVVQDTRGDEEGNTYVLDKEGKEHKIGKNRPPELHQLFNENHDRAIKLIYRSFPGKEGKQITYIHDAELFEGEEGKKLEEKASFDSEPQRKNRCRGLSGAVSIAVAKMNAGEEMDSGKVITLAKRFTKYLDKGE